MRYGGRGLWHQMSEKRLFCFLLLKGTPCFWVRLGASHPVDQRGGSQPWLPIPISWVGLQNPKAVAPNPDQFNQNGAGRESVSIIPGNSQHAQVAQPCSGVCLRLLLKPCSPLTLRMDFSCPLTSYRRGSIPGGPCFKISRRTSWCCRGGSVLPIRVRGHHFQLRKGQVTRWHGASCLSARCPLHRTSGLPWAKVSLLKSAGDLSRFLYTRRKRRFAIE